MLNKELAYELEFSSEEREAIEDYARKLSSLGESVVNDFALNRNYLLLAHIQAAEAAPIGKKLEIIKTGRHQDERLGAIIRQARVLLELRGEDTTSRLNRLKDIATWGKIGE